MHLKQYSRLVGLIWIAYGIYKLITYAAVPLLMHQFSSINIDSFNGLLPILIGTGLLMRRISSWWITIIISSLFLGLCAFGIIWNSWGKGYIWLIHDPVTIYVPIIVLLIIIGLILDRPSKWRTIPTDNC